MWRRLQIVDTGASGAGDDGVSSVPGHPISRDGRHGVLHERSQFQPGRRQQVGVRRRGHVRLTPERGIGVTGTAATGWFAVAALDWEPCTASRTTTPPKGPADFFTGEVYFDVIAKG